MAGPSRGCRPWWMVVLGRTNVIVTGLTAALVLYTRSGGVAYFSIGALMCTISVKVLKHVIRQPRPTNLTSRQKTTYGMPSTHSSSITYFATYMPLACVYLPIHESLPPSVWTRMLPPLLFVPFALAVVLSRIWLGHHTAPQVLVGMSHGLIFAVAWFKLWCGGLDSYGPQIEDLVNGLIGIIS